MKKTLVMLAVFGLLVFSCQKDEPVTPTPEPAVVVPLDFIDRYAGRYVHDIDQEGIRYMIELNEVYIFHVQDYAFESLECWNYTIDTSEVPSLTIESHTPDEFVYRTDEGVRGSRVQTFTKTDNGVRRTRKFYLPSGEEDVQRADFQDFIATTEVAVTCDFDSDYESFYGLDGESTPMDFYDAFIEDIGVYGITTNPGQVIINIVDDETYNDASAGRAAVCIDDVLVDIKQSFWEGAMLYEKFNLMYHEFGHAVFDLKHSCDKRDLMFSSSEIFIDECLANNELVNEYPVSEAPEFFEGFRAALERMVLGENQNVYDCSTLKGIKFIE